MRRLFRKIVRGFNLDACRIYAKGAVDCYFLKYNPPQERNYNGDINRYYFLLSHYEDGWNMEAVYNSRNKMENHKHVKRNQKHYSGGYEKR